MKRSLAILTLSISFVSVFAQNANGLQAISQQTPTVAAYTPYVQIVCYAIAGIICVVGAVWAFLQIQNGRDGKKAIMTTVGSAICFVCMAIALPSFFGIDESGNINITTGNGGMGGNSGLTGDNTGIPQSPINPNVPNISDMKPTIPGGNVGSQSKTITEASGYLTHGSYTNWRGETVIYSRFDPEQLISDYESLTGNTPDFANSGFIDDAASVISNTGGDWQKALDNAWSQYLAMVEWYKSGETAPYSPNEYLQIYHTLEGMADAMGEVMSGKYGNGEYSSQVKDVFGGL